MTLVARYRLGDAVHHGLVEGDRLRRLDSSPLDGLRPTATTDPLTEARLLAPLVPNRIFAIGMNYVGHIREAGAATPEIPLVFMMPSTAVIGPDDAIVLPREAQTVHHECELTVVIGKAGRRIARADALDHVLGHTCANDVSERVIQQREMAGGALTIGKGFDTFCPLGPVIAVGGAMPPGTIRTFVNGRLVQDGTTGDLLFDIPYLVSYLSQAITLLPGDIILTGTPSGVGPLHPGDLCEVEIEGIGRLSNPVVEEA